MHPSVALSIPHIVGTDRFEPYLRAQRGSATEAVRLYAWNIEVSAALLGAYAALEVGLRNAMHDRLSDMFGQSDWWVVTPLRPNESTQIKEARSYLERRKGTGHWGAGHVVAELRASFWEGLLVNRYHAALWEKGLAAAFPHFSGRRAELRARMERLRLLRNRAAHHEPVFARDLEIDHRFMCELSRYVSDDLHNWIASHSRVPDILAGRPATISGDRRPRF